MDGYIFYCSRCPAPHAGECPVVPAPVAPAPTSGRAVVITPGSRWRAQIKSHIDPMGVWTYGAVVEVLGETPDGKKIYYDIPGGTSGYPAPIEAWTDPDGVVDAGGLGRLRFIPIP